MPHVRRNECSEIGRRMAAQAGAAGTCPACGKRGYLISGTALRPDISGFFRKRVAWGRMTTRVTRGGNPHSAVLRKRADAVHVPVWRLPFRAKGAHLIRACGALRQLFRRRMCASWRAPFAHPGFFEIFRDSVGAGWLSRECARRDISLPRAIGACGPFCACVACAEAEMDSRVFGCRGWRLCSV